MSTNADRSQTTILPQRIRSLGTLDRIACWLGIWSLRRLYGECTTDVHDDFPDDPTVHCLGCDATKLIGNMRELQQ